MANNVVVGQATFGQIIGDALSQLAGSNSGGRSIGGLQPHVTMQEVHRDELQITQHPIETGTPVTDHAFPMPYTVEMHIAWSDSTAQTSGFAQVIYQALLAVQASRQPISVTTGKRLYSSMLIRSVMVNTDPESEYVLSVVVLIQQIVITNTQTTSAGAGAAGEAGGGNAGTTDPAANTTDGNSQIGTINYDASGNPTVQVDNGIGTISDNSVAWGNTFGWPNDTAGFGVVQTDSLGTSPPGLGGIGHQ